MCRRAASAKRARALEAVDVDADTANMPLLMNTGLRPGESAIHVVPFAPGRDAGWLRRGPSRRFKRSVTCSVAHRGAAGAGVSDHRLTLDRSRYLPTLREDRTEDAEARIET
jgi:hypothetical protein